MHDHGEDENGRRGYDYHGYGEKDSVDHAIQLVLLFFGWMIGTPLLAGSQRHSATGSLSTIIVVIEKGALHG